MGKRKRSSSQKKCASKALKKEKSGELPFRHNDELINNAKNKEFYISVFQKKEGEKEEFIRNEDLDTRITMFTKSDANLMSNILHEMLKKFNFVFDLKNYLLEDKEDKYGFKAYLESSGDDIIYTLFIYYNYKNLNKFYKNPLKFLKDAKSQKNPEDRLFSEHKINGTRESENHPFNYFSRVLKDKISKETLSSDLNKIAAEDNKEIKKALEEYKKSEEYKFVMSASAKKQQKKRKN